MSAEENPYFRRIEVCEEAIRSFREARRNGTDEAAMERAFERLMGEVKPILERWAKRLASLSPQAVNEAYEAMYDRLLDNLLSETFPSMETKFGSYLKSMPIRILDLVRAKYMRGGVSQLLEDDDAAEEAWTERMEDPKTSGDVETLMNRLAIEQALGQLRGPERAVIRRRLLEEADNQTVARELGVSDATASRLFKRALAQLKVLLAADRAGGEP